MFEKIRMLAVDIDHTLLTDDQRLLPQVIDAVKRARDAGLLIVPATARSPAGLRPIIDALGINEICVCLNGSWVGRIEVDRSQVMQERVLPRELAKDVMVDAMSKGFNPGWYSGENWFSLDDGHLVARERKATGEEPRFISSAEEIPKPAHKILCMAGRSGDKPALKSFGEKYSDRCGVSFSNDVLLEINAPDISKREGVAAVAATYGYHAEDVAAIGDSENDISMIAWAGRGIAMGNAIDELKAIADWTTSSNQDAGVVQVIDRVLKDASVVV